MLICVLFGLVVVLGGLLIFSGVIPVSSQQVSLTVTFRLTDLQYQPLADVPVRLILPCEKNWQEPDSGYRLVTDANGEARLTTKAILDRRWRKMPSNFIGSLIGLPMLTDHLAAGAEMNYMNYHWIYLVDSVLFPDGTTMQDHFSIYSRDEQGRFTEKAIETNGDWMIKDLKGMMISAPGLAPWDYSLDHDASRENWTLKLAFKKSPPAIQR